MKQYRVTKYDPLKRDGSGAYKADDWIGISDIGRAFGGRVLTAEAYLKVEDSYVASVETLMQAAGVRRLMVGGLEKRSLESSLVDFPGAHEFLEAVQDGDYLNDASIATVVRLNLREAMWCMLLEGNDFFVHFGYDFYMYVGLTARKSTPIVLPDGMFLEPFESPYMADDEDDQT